MKVLLFSDLHIQLYNKNNNIQRYLDTLDWVYSVYEKNNCEKMLFLGDWGHTPINTDNIVIYQTVNWLKNIIDKNKIEFYVLVGNHDAPKRTSAKYGLGYMKQFDSINVLNNPDFFEFDDSIFYFIPWTTKPLEQISKFKEQKTNKNKILFGHFETAGSLATTNYRFENGPDASKYTNSFDYVFSGHIHIHQTLNQKFTYVGSVLTTRHGEDGKHGVVIFDTNSLKWEFIENNKISKHITLRPEEITLNNCKGNFVKIIADQFDDLYTLRNEAFELKALTVETKISESKKPEIIKINGFDTENLLEDYLKNNPIPKEYDKKIINELLKSFL